MKLTLLFLLVSVAMSSGAICSWYESGHTTANGERYNPEGMTCASRYHKFGTLLRIEHQGKSIVVRVNDRISKKYAHRIDLSRGAFAKLAGLEVGLIEATITEVAR